MSAPRLYCPQLCAGLITLDAEESHHALSVLRLRVGDAAILFDGAGRAAPARVVSARRRHLELEAASPTECGPRPVPALTLIVAPPRSQRQGFLVEKCVELGVTALVPLEAQRCVVRAGPAIAAKWRRRAAEALKQCGRPYLPTLHDPMSFADSLSLATETVAWLADGDAGAKPISAALAAARNAAAIAVWIGPEGGWADEERQVATERGLLPVRLADYTLRIETAALAVAALVEAARSTRPG